MAEKYDLDIFDEIDEGKDRRGAHRAPIRRGAGWIKFAWAALATGALVVVGVGTILVNSPTMNVEDFQKLFFIAAPTKSPTPTPTATPTMDSAVTVNVINASGETGVASQVGEQLAATGWTVLASTNADSTVKKTYVYYGDPSLEGVARGLVESFGFGEIKLTDDYSETSSQLTLVIGKNYQP